MIVLDDHGSDQRGRSLSLSLSHAEELAAAYGPPFALADAHITTTVPGAVRGNHYHLVQHEILVVVPADAWSFHWDDGQGTPVRRRMFRGDQAAAIFLPPSCAHAIRNDGDAVLIIIGLTDRPYDSNAPDVSRREVVSL